MKEKKSPKKSWIYYYVMTFIVVVLLNTVVFPFISQREVKEVGYNNFLEDLEKGKISEVAMGDKQIVYSIKDSKGNEKIL